MGPSEMILLPVALRQLEPHSELETVQYCSFWSAVALHVPWRHEKISSAPQLQMQRISASARIKPSVRLWRSDGPRKMNSGVYDTLCRTVVSTIQWWRTSPGAGLTPRTAFG